MDEIFTFFIDNFPSVKAIFIGGPIGLLWAFLCLYVAGLFKQKVGLKTGYTRKIFHFSIFTSVAIIQFIWGTPIVCLFGGMTTIVIFIAILLGDGNIFYEAMAREKDEPHRSYFIIVPYFATLIGGLTSNIFWGEFAIFGYLVTGFGDAIGEPVGTRFGAHEYRVPSLKGVKTKRSFEGSFAVFVASIIAISIGIILTPTMSLHSSMILKIFVIGLLSTVVEAVSPHGWDNTTMQILPTLMAKYLL
jgi:phytol kinase